MVSHPGSIAENDIVYGTGSGRDLMLDILRPDVPLEPARPLVIWVHGGGWREGDRAATPNPPLVDRGFVTASISYRFSDEAVFPAQVHDVKAAIRFLRANASRWGIDPARIGIWGHSAGGHLAALAATTNSIDTLEGEGGSPDHDSSVQASVPLSPPTDFLVDWFAESAFPPHEIALEAVDDLFGGLDQSTPERIELARAASPVHHTSGDDPPMLVVHGALDDLVPIEQGRALVLAMQAHGVDSSLLELPHDDHGLISVFGDDDIGPDHLEIHDPLTPAMQEIIDFLERTLGPVE